MRVLIVEDDPLLKNSLIRTMQTAGHVVDHSADGETALHMLRSQAYDLLLLDLGLPRMDGLELLEHLRAEHSAIPIPVLILTARDSVEDRVRGLDLGADDYLVKPFSMAELEARVRALSRRGYGHNPIIACGGLTFDSIHRRALVEGTILDLSQKELALLETLLLNMGYVVSKDQMLDRLYGYDEEASPNAIEVCVHRLRKKLEPSGANIRTLRGLGYLLDKA